MDSKDNHIARYNDRNISTVSPTQTDRQLDKSFLKFEKVTFDSKESFLKYFHFLQMSTSNSPMNWKDWNDRKHFSDYSRKSKLGKIVNFSLFALLMIPLGFLGYMTTI